MGHIFGLSDNSSFWLLYSWTLSNCSKSFLKLNPQNCLVLAQLRPQWHSTQLLHFFVYTTGNTAYSIFLILGNKSQLLTPLWRYPFTGYICRGVFVLINFIYTCPYWTSSIFYFCCKHHVALPHVLWCVCKDIHVIWKLSFLKIFDEQTW